MKGKVGFRLMLVLLILLIMPFCLSFVGCSGEKTPPRNPSTPLDTYSISESSISLTWTSRWQNEFLYVDNHSTIVGDHITLRSSWESPVNSSRMSIIHGFNETRNGTVLGPIIDEWPIGDPQDYGWETFDAITVGDDVNVELNLSQNGDPAFDVWSWTDLDSDNEVDSDELGSNTLLSVDDWALGKSESGSFVSSYVGSIAIRIWCWLYAYSENMTYDLQVDVGLFIDIDNELDNPSEVIYDTYNFLDNIKVNITLLGWNGSDVMVVEFRNISIHNFFAPEITDISVLDYGFNIFNFSWSCIDKNANDTNFFSIWISQDYGVSYYLLGRNLTQSHYVWDSTGFTILEYMVRVRVYSLDFTFGNYCSTASPPSSYWPGDFSDATVELAAGDVHSGHPTFFTVTINEHPDISYAEGTTSNVIVWVPTFDNYPPSQVYYTVYCDNTRWTTGVFHLSSDRVIEVDVDGLEIGMYAFYIRIDWCVFASVMVTVYPNPDSPLLQLIHYGAIGVSIGSSFVIIAVVVMTIRLWKSRDPIIVD